MSKNNKSNKLVDKATYHHNDGLEKIVDVSSDSEVDSNKDYKIDKPDANTSKTKSTHLDESKTIRKEKTEAQIKAFEKARLKRAENILKRQEERKKEQEEFYQIKEMKKQIKELKTKKKQEIELKKYDTESDSEDEPQIVVKRKTTKKKQPKVIYIDDDDEKDDKNIIIVNKMEKSQPPPQQINVKAKPKAIFL